LTNRGSDVGRVGEYHAKFEDAEMSRDSVHLQDQIELICYNTGNLYLKIFLIEGCVTEDSKSASSRVI
jgi:hypothetical protein